MEGGGIDERATKQDVEQSGDTWWCRWGVWIDFVMIWTYYLLMVFTLGIVNWRLAAPLCDISNHSQSTAVG